MGKLQQRSRHVDRWDDQIVTKIRLSHGEIRDRETNSEEYGKNDQKKKIIRKRKKMMDGLRYAWIETQNAERLISVVMGDDIPCFNWGRNGGLLDLAGATEFNEDPCSIG